ncbi:MAG: hypothetical protein U1F53_21945 [Burkholderiaceae bacterium]
MHTSRNPMTTALSALTLAAALAGCGGGGGDGSDDKAFTASCKTDAYAAGSVELPTGDQIKLIAGTYNGDEGSYDMSGNFTKSGSATLAIADNGRVTYKGVAYEPTSLCIDKTSGTYGKILYFIVDKGGFDVADKVDSALGQAWGVSPADGTTMFANGRK